MRILALSDIHGDARRLLAIAAAAGAFDLVLAAGDFTEFGGAEALDAVLAALGERRSTLVGVPGNCDRRSARERLSELGLSADGRVVERDGLLAAGVGGGMLLSGLTPYERRDEELGAALERSLSDASRRSAALGPGMGKPLAVLSHHPPRDTGADDRKGAPVGSPALRSLLDQAAPPLWICGHIHESPSARRVGRTLVVNPGPANRGRYALVDLARDLRGQWAATAELFG